MVPLLAVSVLPTSAVPEIVGRPVAALLRISFARLVRDSANPSSSVNDTVTVISWPSSSSVTVYRRDVSPVMAVPLRSHWKV